MKMRTDINDNPADAVAESLSAAKGWLCLVLLFLLLSACTQPQEHTAPAINDRDSVAVMTSYGVNTLISDSGVIKYRIVAEEWIVNQNVHPSRWIFPKGVLLTQFDQTMHIQAYIQADTAYYFDQLNRWTLKGNVRIRTKQGLRFTSEELFWDAQSHEIWSNRYSRLVTPERTLEGNYFKSNEQMTQYIVTNTRGSFERGDFGDTPATNPRDSMRQAQKADSARRNPPRQTTIPLPGHKPKDNKQK